MQSGLFSKGTSSNSHSSLYLNDNAQIVSSEIANVGKRQSIQTHSKISIPEIDFEMFSVVFLEDGFVYIFELRTVSDIVSKFMEIVRTFEILE